MESELTSSRSCLVDIIVRNVYTPSQSVSLSVDSTLLIGELKSRLSLVFPLHPPVASQKLIFGGKICTDDERLTQLLVPLQKSHDEKKDEKKTEAVVFHLLVSSKDGSMDKKKVRKTSKREVTYSQASPRPSSTTAAAAVSTPGPLLTEVEQHHFVGQSLLMQQQAMILQQIQYLQYLLLQQRHQEAMATRELPLGAAPYGPFYGILPPPMFQARPQVLPPTRASTTNDPRQNRVMGMEMVREVFALLDFRLALKMAFMLFIIGQDMPTDRILMLGLLSLISYLHITGIFTKIYDVYNRHRSVRDGTAPNARTDPDASGAAAAAGAAIVNRCGVLTRVLRIPADRGLVHDVKSFVVGLLLSLVPTWHPQPLQGAAPMRENALPNDMPIQEI